MERKPAGLCEMIESILSADSADKLKDNLTKLVRETLRVFQSVKKKFTSPKKFRQMSSKERMRRCSQTGAIRCIMRPKGRTDTLRL